MESAVLREDMVDGLAHESKGWLETDRVVGAMRTVPREPFLDDGADAYADRAHDCHGTRVLSPSTAARFMEALAVEPGDDVLIVGIGVGYTAALAAEIAGEEHVQGIDIARRLVLEARSNLARAGYRGVLVDRRDGAEGLPEYGPYDRILLEAAAVEPPRPLLDQLAPDGRLVFPQGAGTQTLTVHEAGGTVEEHGAIALGPMLVEGEQADTVERNRTRREDRERAERSARARSGWEQEWIDWDGA